MRGQWLGDYEGDTTGKLMINVDELDNGFAGVAYVKPEMHDIPGTIVYLETKSKEAEQSSIAYTYPIDPRTGFQTSWDEIKPLYPDGTSHSKTAEVRLKVSGDVLAVDAVSDIGIKLKATLTRSSSDGKSKIKRRQMSWPEFKSHVSTIAKSGYLFRGQQKPWRLCTSFHRRGRFRISEFTGKDVKQLHQKLSAITTHYFDLNVPDQNGAFFNLLQHHGYPTPLLDWSHSPYVAAFFAFRDRPIGYDGDEVVRICMFNNREWQNKYRQIQNIDPPFPHLSVLEFIAIGNPRLVPQQAVTTVTNLSDIETYILEKEEETGLSFLEVVDIPAKERELAMTDLRFMGITAGSMFPGIDGVCEEVRERNFDR